MDPPSPAPRTPGAEPRSRPLVLHVDDDEATRYFAARLLDRAGFDAAGAATGREALARLEDRPDAILLDVRLPDVSGFLLCRHLRGDPRAAALPVVLLSASHPLPEDQRYALSVGADAYLVHPVDGSVLTETLRRLIGRSSVERPSPGAP